MKERAGLHQIAASSAIENVGDSVFRTGNPASKSLWPFKGATNAWSSSFPWRFRPGCRNDMATGNDHEGRAIGSGRESLPEVSCHRRRLIKAVTSSMQISDLFFNRLEQNRKPEEFGQGMNSEFFHEAGAPHFDGSWRDLEL